MMTDEERATHLQGLREKGWVRDFPFRSNGHSISSWPRGIAEGDPVPCAVYRDWEDAPDDPRMWTVSPFGYDFTSQCGTCGAWTDMYAANMDGFVGPMKPCEFKGEATVTEFTVKSGRLIIDDDLRDVFKDFNDEEENFAAYNSKLGQKQVIEYYSKMGYAYGPVGNSSPSLYRIDKNSYVIANPPYDEDNDGSTPDPSWESLGWFCTDLWAYSMADYEDYLAVGGRPIEELDAEGNWTRKVIDFPVGTYRITHHTTDVGWTEDYEGGTVYASIEKID